MLRRDCRHRLGLTVGGAVSLERKPYGSSDHTTLPCGDVILASGMVPRKPRAASSKSVVSSNGSALSIAACCAITDAVASFGAPRALSFAASALGACVISSSRLLPGI
jgi:hypothetical protein